MRRRYRGPALTVDAVWVARNRVLLVRRRNPPFRGRWAFPGGFVEMGETVEQAVVRELFEETGLRPDGLRLLGVYSRPGRDPRGPTVTVAFRMRGSPLPPRGASDAIEARWVSVRRAPALAFDHDEILADASRPAGARGRVSPGGAKDPGRAGLFLPGVLAVRGVARSLQSGTIAVAGRARAGRDVDDVPATALRTFVVGHRRIPRSGSASGLYKHRERPGKHSRR